MLWQFVVSILAQLTALCQAGRVVDFAVIASSQKTFEDHVQDSLADVMQGVWNTDYWLPYEVDVVAADLDGSGSNNFVAEWKLAGRSSEIRYVTVTSVLSFEGTKPGETLAEVVQKYDLTKSDVHRRGRLYLEENSRSAAKPEGRQAAAEPEKEEEMQRVVQSMEQKAEERRAANEAVNDAGKRMRWVIEWEPDHAKGTRRKWWRWVHADEQPKVEPDSEDTAKRAEKLSVALVKQWDLECRANRKQWKEIKYSVLIAVQVALGWKGPSGAITAELNIAAEEAAAYSDHFLCLSQQMDAFSRRKAEQKANAQQKTGEMTPAPQDNVTLQAATQAENPRELQSLTKVQMLLSFLNSMQGACNPSLTIGVRFDIVMYPPFLWPIPTLAFDFGWRHPVDEIMRCFQAAALNTGMMVATNASQDLVDNITQVAEKTKKQVVGVVQQALMARLGKYLPNATNATEVVKDLDSTIPSEKKNSDGWSQGKFSQGPRFMFFPPGIAWRWRLEYTWAIKKRRMLKNFIACNGTEDCAPECDSDKEGLYREVAGWARAFHDLMTSSDSKCLDTQRDIRATWGVGGDPARPIFDLVEGKAFLDSRTTASDTSVDFSSFSAGGVASVGTDGVSVGIYQRFDGKATVGKDSQCSKFQDFLNIYYNAVRPALEDVHKSCKAGETVELADLHALSHQSCKNVDLGNGPEFPEDEGPNAGKRSRCEVCLRTVSIGMPCSYCSGFVGDSCRQFFGSSDLVPCPGGSVALPLVYFPPKTRPAKTVEVARAMCKEVRQQVLAKRASLDPFSLPVGPVDLVRSAFSSYMSSVDPLR